MTSEVGSPKKVSGSATLKQRRLSAGLASSSPWRRATIWAKERSPSQPAGSQLAVLAGAAQLVKDVDERRPSLDRAPLQDGLLEGLHDEAVALEAARDGVAERLHAAQGARPGSTAERLATA